ncbi:MAG: TlpA disulfide reductase family protein [Odoribacter sp.]
MKKLLYLIAAVLLLMSNTQQPDGFEVSIELKNAVDGPVFVNQRIPNQTAWYTDTLQLKDGKVVFKGEVDYPRMVTFVFHSGEEDFHGSFSVFLDNSTVNVTGDYNNLKNLKIVGSRSHDEYMTIEKNGKSIFENYKRLTHKRGKAFKDNRALYDSLTPYCVDAYNKVFEYITTLPGYATSETIAYFVSEYFNINDMEKFEKALNGFAPSMAKNAYIADCREGLEKEKKVQPGKPAYDFTLSDINGKEYKLSDYRGKYVLLEFSASWCGWCKLEIPFLKTVYENTKGKNFVMLTVNLDEEKKKWEEDVKQYNLPWPVISDLKAFKGPVPDHYNISGIPVIYLISPDGVILTKELRREGMIEYINSLFNQK